MIVSCSSRSPVEQGLKLEWSYAELSKDASGQVSETGNKGSDKSAAIGQLIESNLWSMELAKVEPTQATFRVTHPSGLEQRIIVEKGNAKEIWLDDESLGIKIRVEGIKDESGL